MRRPIEPGSRGVEPMSRRIESMGRDIATVQGRIETMRGEHGSPLRIIEHFRPRHDSPARNPASPSLARCEEGNFARLSSRQTSFALLTAE
jgi:hypothetical protein